jgi:hypothetical protein
MRRFIGGFCVLLISLSPLPGLAEDELSLVTADELITRAFTGPIDRISVNVFNGSIDVATAPGKSVKAGITKRGSGRNLSEAQADLKNIQVTMLQKGGILTIVAQRMDKQSKPNSGALAKLNVPAGVALDLHTSNDKISIMGPVGKTEAQSANGAISIQDAKGALKLYTSNAAIDVQGGSGVLDLQTSNDNIMIHSNNTVISAQTSNGEITFAGKPGRGNHLFSTTSGDVVLKFPADFRFKIDAETSNGIIDSEFPASPQLAPEATTFKSAVGAPSGVVVTVRTSNADIHFKNLK